MIKIGGTLKECAFVVVFLVKTIMSFIQPAPIECIMFPWITYTYFLHFLVLVERKPCI